MSIDYNTTHAFLPNEIHKSWNVSMSLDVLDVAVDDISTKGVGAGHL